MGCYVTAKKMNSVSYMRRDEPSIAPDGVIQVGDQVSIPPTCRRQILESLHSARQACWCPIINHDISQFAQDCRKF